ncbi:MAG: hypothetical protein J3R72DRAFT_415791 [Linnemannia gamsii]|nr:MAG: hypothetical protein J3R72DRAFT_415791 [Linnemannia gamsii]
MPPVTRLQTRVVAAKSRSSKNKNINVNNNNNSNDTNKAYQSRPRGTARRSWRAKGDIERQQGPQAALPHKSQSTTPRVQIVHYRNKRRAETPPAEKPSYTPTQNPRTPQAQAEDSSTAFAQIEDIQPRISQHLTPADSGNEWSTSETHFNSTTPRVLGPARSSPGDSAPIPSHQLQSPTCGRSMQLSHRSTPLCSWGQDSEAGPSRVPNFSTESSKSSPPSATSSLFSDNQRRFRPESLSTRFGQEQEQGQGFADLLTQQEGLGGFDHRSPSTDYLFDSNMYIPDLADLTPGYASTVAPSPLSEDEGLFVQQMFLAGEYEYYDVPGSATPTMHHQSPPSRLLPRSATVAATGRPPPYIRSPVERSPTVDPYQAERESYLHQRMSVRMWELDQLEQRHRREREQQRQELEQQMQDHALQQQLMENRHTIERALFLRTVFTSGMGGSG